MLCILCVLSFSGCLAYIIGDKVNHPKPGQEGYISRTFTCHYQDCFEHTESILEDMGVSIYRKNKAQGVISAKDFTPVFKQCSNSTEVGISFKETGQFQTEISVACGNVNLANFASDQIYSKLEERLLETSVNRALEP
jgi:hypothetical protein